MGALVPACVVSREVPRAKRKFKVSKAPFVIVHPQHSAAFAAKCALGVVEAIRLSIVGIFDRLVNAATRLFVIHVLVLESR